MEQSTKKVITVYTEANPNPSSLKFCVEFLLLAEGTSLDFPDSASAHNSPFASELFKFSFVKRVFIASNFVTITKDASDWNDIIPILKTYIKSYLEEEKPLVYDKTDSTTLDTDTEIEKQIKSILDEYVRPNVEQDGGAIIFDSFDETTGVVLVKLQGSCSGCPSSTLTLKSGIENLLMRMIPEVKQVVAEGV